MSDFEQSIRTVTLAYFSGTGCTQAVVDCFEKQMITFDVNITKINIAEDRFSNIPKTDLLIIFSPVYAFRIASIMEKWIGSLKNGNGTYVAILSVSGGGEISPNTACRMKCKHILKKKNYDLRYEQMLVMPSNFAIQAKEELNYDLIKILPLKVSKIIDSIMEGKQNILQPNLQDRFFAVMGLIEHLGASLFAKSIQATDSCRQCGLCVRNCPMKNIRLQNGKPIFGIRCLWCMKCIYSCPQKALRPRLFKFTVLEKGFDITKMTEVVCRKSENRETDNKKSMLWKGVLRYLKEE